MTHELSGATPPPTLSPTAWARPDAESPGGLRVEEVDHVLVEADRWLASTALLGDASVRAELRTRGAGLRQRRDELLSPLRIVIAGGTGVGKSTLLNALAGAAIAPASEVRPCTQHVTVYAHRQNAAAVDPAWCGPDHVRYHERPELLNKLVIDTPDFDSLAREHRERTARVMAAADLILFVVTVQKYADLAGARWLARHAADRAVLFLLNRADEGLAPEILADLRERLQAQGYPEPEILPLSAAAALAARAAGAAAAPADPAAGLGPGEAEGAVAAAVGAAGSGFDALEARLIAELDARRVRDLKASNLAGAVATWLRQLEAAVPTGLPERLAAWRDGAAGLYDGLRTQLVGAIYPALARDGRLVRHAEYRFGTAMGGPVGLCLALVNFARSVLLPDYPRFWGISTAPSIELVGEPERLRQTGQEVELAQEQLRNLALTLGLPHGPDTLPEPEALAARSALLSIDDRLGATLDRGLREALEIPRRGQRLAALVANVPAVVFLVGIPGFWLYDRIRALWGGSLLITGDYFQGAGVVLLLWLGLATWLADWRTRRRARRFVAAQQGRVAEAIDETLRPKLLGRLDERLRELQEEATALSRLAARLDPAEGGGSL